MPSPLLDPTPPLGIGILAMLVLLAWSMTAVPQAQRLSALRVIATHVGVTAAALAGISVWVGRSAGPGANPFIGRVVQVFVAAAMVGLVSVIAAARIRGLAPGEEAPEAGGARAAVAAPAPKARQKTPGALVVLGFAAVLGLLFVFLWLVLARAG